MTAQIQPQVYQGQFGEFTITDRDRLGVIIYRGGLVISAISFILGSSLILWPGNQSVILQLLTPLLVIFSLGLGISLLSIHIYLATLHRLLQAFWLIGTGSAVIIGIKSTESLALSVYHHPITLLGIGFLFAALTGIYFKEAFCFNRLETKLLTPIVPGLLLGHLMGILPTTVERGLLLVWSILFLVFVIRKVIQPIPPDIGDKSVFDYLHKKSH